jgi:TRAP-type C4-dicarboxylate transport system permease small subunit
LGGASAPPNLSNKRGTSMIRKLLDRGTSILTKIASVILIVVSISTLANIIMRTMFKLPIPGAIEIVQYGMLVAAGIILCRTGLLRKHVAVTMLVDWFPKRIGNVFRTLTSFIALFIFAYVSFRFFSEFPEIIAIGRSTEVLRIPVAFTYIVMAICMLFAAIAFLYWTVIYAKSIVNPDRALPSVGSKTGTEDEEI